MSESIQEKIALVTGATSGIGRVVSKILAEQGATVVLACRDRFRAEETMSDIVAETGNNNVHVLLTELSSEEKIRSLAEELKRSFSRLDILINNAGYLPGKRELTECGIEKSFYVNYLAPFLLTNLLLPSLIKSRSARIVNVSSFLHRIAKIPWNDFAMEKNYGPYRAYARSKLGNVMFTRELDKRLRLAGIRHIAVNAVHPGNIASGFGDTTSWPLCAVIKAARPFLMSSEDGALPLSFLAGSEEVDGVSGGYFSKTFEKSPSRYSLSDKLCQRLWEESAKMANLTEEESSMLCGY